MLLMYLGGQYQSRSCRCMMEGVDWFHVAQDRDKWRAAVRSLMTRKVPQNYREFNDWLRNYKHLFLNKTLNVRLNVTLRRVPATIVTVKKQ